MLSHGTANFSRRNRSLGEMDQREEQLAVINRYDALYKPIWTSDGSGVAEAPPLCRSHEPGEATLSVRGPLLRISGLNGFSRSNLNDCGREKVTS